MVRRTPACMVAGRHVHCSQSFDGRDHWPCPHGKVKPPRQGTRHGSTPATGQATIPATARRLVILLVLSPAKTLDYDSAPVTERYSRPEHLEQAAELINVLRELTPAQVSELMHLSDKLAGLNVARYASWHRDFTPQ